MKITSCLFFLHLQCHNHPKVCRVLKVKVSDFSSGVINYLPTLTLTISNNTVCNVSKISHPIVIHSSVTELKKSFSYFRKKVKLLKRTNSLNFLQPEQVPLHQDDHLDDHQADHQADHLADHQADHLADHLVDHNLHGRYAVA